VLCGIPTVASRHYAFTVPVLVHPRYVQLYRVLRERHIRNGGDLTKGSTKEGRVLCGLPTFPSRVLGALHMVILLVEACLLGGH